MTGPWTDVRVRDVEEINRGLDPTRPIADVAIYHPDNLDPAHSAKVTLDLLLDGFRAATEIFAEAGVSLRLARLRSGPLDPTLFAVESTDGAKDTPGDRFVDMYTAAERRPSRISSRAEQAFRAMVPDEPGADRMIHLVTLQDVYMSFYEQLDFRTFQRKTITTGGLSFPGYMYGATMPRHLRGVITICDLTKDENSWKTVAHELGHKLINVSHEYRGTSPQHEVRADGGLMLYGAGTEIPSGAAGRYHRERLHRSPHLYRIDDSGRRVYNPDYESDGFYHDGIYAGVSMQLDPPDH